ncbi:tRNA-uridine aminocarboxypropyltransferase [Pseudoalteromonas sp. SSDWG2]|uniref:tRNA-uridine aminocarboxypropyltransferase n=1 Tax=Pseudoalteromonas sp. SSDWG2 TaxID=3139391 RepID=UPI003BAD58A8
MARTVCSTCNYPTTSCVCEHVQHVANQTCVWVLQHPHETSQAKSTVPLLGLSLNKLRICVGEFPDDFTDVQALLPQHCALLYPCDNALPLEHLDNAAKTQIKHLIVIDGTWGKVHRIWQQNPWLHSLNALSFAQVPASRYAIRKANREHSLSTLEATAYCLEYLERLDAQPLRVLLDGFVKVQTQHMPADVKTRYQL